MSKDISDQEHDVGYGKPPVHSRFKKGKSGNPRGRPKGSTNHRTQLCRVLDEKITVRENGKSRRMTKLGAAATQQVNRLSAATPDRFTQQPSSWSRWWGKSRRKSAAT